MSGDYATASPVKLSRGPKGLKRFWFKEGAKGTEVYSAFAENEQQAVEKVAKATSIPVKRLKATTNPRRKSQ